MLPREPVNGVTPRELAPPAPTGSGFPHWLPGLGQHRFNRRYTNRPLLRASIFASTAMVEFGALLWTSMLWNWLFI